MALFGFLKREKQTLHLLLDRDSSLLAKGEVQKNADGVNIQLKIVEGNTDAVVKAEIIQVVPMDNREAVVLGKVIFRRGNNIALEPMRKLGSEVRKNFRMPVDFESFIYPPSGGRYIIKSIDLSCGGIAFYSTAQLQPGDVTEVVIPITADGPLIVRCTILRVIAFAPPIQQYACQFLDLVHDEEAMIQEAVFSIQLEHIRVNRQQGRR